MKYQIDQSGKIENTGKQMMLVSGYFATKKSAFADLVRLTSLRINWPDNLESSLLPVTPIVNRALLGVDPPGVKPGRLGLSDQSSKSAEPTPKLVSHFGLKPSIAQKMKSDKVLSLKEILQTIKKTDGRLRECLATLVGVQPRSMNRYYQPKNKKSRRGLFMRISSTKAHG